MLHDDRRCSGVQSAKFGVTWENRQEVRKRFRATVLKSREQQAISPVVQQKNIDWKNFDGGGRWGTPGIPEHSAPHSAFGQLAAQPPPAWEPYRSEPSSIYLGTCVLGGGSGWGLLVLQV
ncbi:hypothetical protein NDU88_004999 [Pleurodeles waltl]|uniref:Uncharacterized protein n=1 Tax=Pleurodeles waltl TaxID=8319 RepID=A0AAV7VHU3_PLEWA|nr:hypothetical protein NDU88_004999 [Pleurodeles waltl]